MRELQLRPGLATLLDDADYERARQFKWYAKRYGTRREALYAVRKTSRLEHPEHKQRLLALHRWLMDLPFGDPRVIDHINGNTLDNRKSNLRLASVAENNRNSKPRKNLAGFKGVSKNRNRWQATIQHRGVVRYLGSFIHPEDAARAYDKAARELFGEFAYLNFN